MKEKEKSSLVDLGKRLLEASRKGQADEVSVLMASGAPFTTDWLGTSPLHLAAQHGHTQTAEVLLRAGVSRDARTKVDRTPLHMAAQHGHMRLVELLISSGACANNRDMLNMTPLHWACEHNHVDIVKILMRAGAKTDIKSKFGKTPVDIARAKGYSDVLVTLASDQDQDLTVAKVQKRPVDRSNLALNSVKKRQRTKKFPMTAGSWTGPEGPSENGGKPRRKATTPAGVSPKSAVSGGRRVSAPPQFPNAGSPSLRSPTENSIASLVSAAAIVKAKSESEGESHETIALPENKNTTSNTKTQDSSVLDTLATLATATLSHGTPATPTSSVQQVTAVGGRSFGIAPLTLPPTTPTLSTPLTPSGNLFPLPSPLAALSALSSLSSPAQTSPLSNVAMSPLPFSLPVTMSSQQGTSSGAQLMPLGVASWVQSGAPYVTTSSGVSIPQALSTVSTSSSASDVATPTIASVSAAADSAGKGVAFSASGAQSQTVLPQHFTIAPIQLSGGAGQSQFHTQLAISQMLAPIQGVLELNSAATKDGVAQGKVDQGDATKGQNQDITHSQVQQDSNETKQDEMNTQSMPSTQEVLITLQVPAALQHIQPQIVSSDPAFSLQQVQVLQQVAGQDSQQHAAATQVPSGQVTQQQFSIVQQQDGSTQTPQEQAAGSHTPQAQIVQLQLPQEQLNLAHLMHNVGHGSLPLTFSSPLTSQQMQLLTNTQIQISGQTSQQRPPQQQQLQSQPQQQPLTGPQQQQQHNITQQLLAQSVPQRTLIPQSYVTQLGQAQVQSTVDVQPQQQQPQQAQQNTPLPVAPAQAAGTFGPHVLLQVQEDLRKLLEQRQAEEDRARKELEGKLYILQRDSEKYRTELAHAQKEAEDYRGRLEIEMREKTRLHQLYEASKQPPVTSSGDNRSNTVVKSESDTLM